MKYEVIQDWDINDDRLAELLSDGYTLLKVVPLIRSTYNATIIETNVLYILSRPKPEI